MFAEVLGIRPWEWDGLLVEDVIRLRTYIDKQIEEARKHESG